jgi:hypothetical protein
MENVLEVTTIILFALNHPIEAIGLDFVQSVFCYSMARGSDVFFQLVHRTWLVSVDGVL